MTEARVQKVVDEVAAKSAAKWATLTTSKLELMALRAYPSSPVQIAIRQEINKRKGI